MTNDYSKGEKRYEETCDFREHVDLRAWHPSSRAAECSNADLRGVYSFVASGALNAARLRHRWA